MKTSNLLRTLIGACVDDERTLQHERNFVDTHRAETLALLFNERGTFIADLERLGERTQRRPSGSWGELLREAGRNFWVLAAGRNNGDAIAICRQSRARTEARYDAALQRSWPDAIERVLSAHRRRLHDETTLLNRMQF